MKYLGIPIEMYKINDAIVIDYDKKLNKIARKPLEPNMIFACFEKLIEKYEFEGYWTFLGTQYRREYEVLTKEIFDEMQKTFFDEMSENVENMLKLVLEVMDTPLCNYLTYSSNEAFDVLKYFAEVGEIPDIDDFYALRVNEYYAGIKQYRFQNIKRETRYTIYDYTEGEYKRHQKMKNKFVVKIDENGEYNKVLKRFTTFDDAMNFIRSKVNFVKGV